MAETVTKFRDLPITTSPGTDNYRSLHFILRQLEDQGSFFEAALLADAMMRDDRIFGVMQTRSNALLGAPVKFAAGSESPTAQRALELVEGNQSSPGFYAQSFTPTSLADLLFWGRMLGIGVAELTWSQQGAITVPSLKTWHPQFINWDTLTRSYWINTESGREELPQPGQADGRWVVFTPYGYQYGWLRGLVRSLAKLYLGRGWAYRDWFRYSEKHGQPLDLVYVPEQAPDKQADDFFRAVARRNSETAIKIPRTDTDGASYDVKMLEATARSWDGFAQLIDRINTDVAVAVLGQNLTTEVQGGSLAAAKVSNQVRGDYLRADAEALQSVIFDQVMVPWARFNFGDPTVAPVVTFDIEPPEDLQGHATALATLATAIGTFGAAGVNVDSDRLLEEFGVPVTEALTQDSVTTTIRNMADGWHVFSQDGTRHLGGPFATEEEARRRLAEIERIKGAEQTALAADRPKSRQPRRYEDRLARRARQQAATALQPTVEAILSAVNQATDYADLKARLLEVYKGADVKIMQRTLERAIIMARLAGRADVVKDL